LKKLKKLYLNNNEFKIFPESITELTALRDLYLYENSIESIPESIDKLKKLDIFDLENNLIEHLPKSLIELKLDDLRVDLNSLDFGDLETWEVLQHFQERIHIDLPPKPDNITDADKVKVKK